MAWTGGWGVRSRWGTTLAGAATAVLLAQACQLTPIPVDGDGPSVGVAGSDGSGGTAGGGDSAVTGGRSFVGTGGRPTTGGQPGVSGEGGLGGQGEEAPEIGLSGGEDLAWAVQLPTEESEEVWALRVGAEGHVYLVVTHPARWGDELGNVLEFFLLEFDSAGAFIEQRSLGAFENYGGMAFGGVAIDPNGAVVLVGQVTEVFETKNEDFYSLCDYFVSKHDAEGRESWKVRDGKPHGDGDVDQANAVALDADGNLYVIGQIEGNALHDQVNENSPQRDYFLIKYDAAGQRIWTRLLDSLGFQGPKIGMSGGDVVIVFEGRSAEPQSGVFVAQYDPEGNEKWRTFDGVGQRDYLYYEFVVGSSTGHAFVGTEWTVDLVGGSWTRRASRVTEYDEEGGLVWSGDLPCTVAAAFGSGDATYFLGDTSKGCNGENGDVVLSKRIGTDIVWTHELGTDVTEIPRALAFDAEGSLYIALETTGHLAAVNPNPPKTDVVLLKYEASALEDL